MCNDHNLFQKINHSENLGWVKIADGKNYSIKATGTVSLSVRHDSEIILLVLHNVNYVPQFDTNLISVRELTKKGMSITFSENGCHALTNGTVIELAKYATSGYVLNEFKSSHEARPCIHEWHNRMAHKNIKAILQSKTTLGLKITKCACTNECIPCLQGKLPALPFPKLAEKPNKCLDIVVSDVGQMPVESLGKSRYFITFTDVFSDYTEVVSIHKKSEAKQCIINYIERLKTKKMAKPRIFRSDNGGEYVDRELVNYMEGEGIDLQYTVHDCPEQNGIAERKNRTLCDAIRTMLKSSGLPLSFWAEAMANAVYTFNRIPRTNMSKSPLEIFTEKHRTPFFIEFGAPVCVATKAQGRKKLDDRGAFMRFLSVDSQSKGFRLWDGHTVRVERNVKFLNSKAGELSFEKFYRETPTKTFLNRNENKQSSDSEHAQPRRSERIKLQIEQNAATIINKLEPKTYNQAIKSPDSIKWILAMQEELQSIEDNQTWLAVDLPPGRNTIGSKWTYKLKCDSDGNIARYKARIVAQGFSQKYGVDYDEVFAPVARSTTFRTLLSVAGKENYIVKQFDVKTAFLNGDLTEEIYMRPPEGVDIGNKVLKLNKSLYGLKQAARAWNIALNKSLTNCGFERSKTDNCL